MSDLVTLEKSLIGSSRPLPWPVYDSQGKMLLRKGYVVKDEAQRDELINRGVYRRKSDDPNYQEEKKVFKEDVSPFQLLEELTQDLEKALNFIVNSNPNAINNIEQVSQKLLDIFSEHPDASLGYIHLHSGPLSSIEHYLAYGILACAVGQKLGYNDEQLKLMVNIAITANVAFSTVHSQLNERNIKLSEQQKEIIKKHPIQSAALLKKLGLTDATWLKSVEQHHRTACGEGYPNTDDTDLLQEAKIMNLCEHYVALINHRGYRDRKHGNEALREIYRRASHDPDEPAYLAFLNALSAYPPGTFALLMNGEVALVTHRAPIKSKPMVKAIISPRGGPYTGYYLRDCNKQETSIREPVVMDKIPALDRNVLWDYSKPLAERMANRH